MATSSVGWLIVGLLAEHADVFLGEVVGEPVERVSNEGVTGGHDEAAPAHR